MKGFLAGAVAVALVAAGLDLALTRAAETRASDQASVLLDAPATVDLQGWPVSLRLLFGSLEGVAAHAENVPTDSGVRLKELDVTVSDVRLRLADLSEGRPPTGARDGMFTARLDAEAVEQLLGELAPRVRVEIGDGVLAAEIGSVRIEVEVGVEEGNLLLTLVSGPAVLPRRIAVQLPALPVGTTVQRVTVRGGLLQLEGMFDPAVLLGLLPA